MNFWSCYYYDSEMKIDLLQLCPKSNVARYFGFDASLVISLTRAIISLLIMHIPGLWLICSSTHKYLFFSHRIFSNLFFSYSNAMLKPVRALHDGDRSRQCEADWLATESDPDCQGIVADLLSWVALGADDGARKGDWDGSGAGVAVGTADGGAGDLATGDGP